MNTEDNFIPRETKLKFKETLKSFILDYFKAKSEGEQTICSFGVFTDSDISSFTIACNTQNGKAQNIRSDDVKWWMPEWALNSASDEKQYHKDERCKYLEKTINELIEKSNWDLDETKNTFAIYKREMFDCMCDALKELKEEGLFKDVRKDFLLLVQESDNGIYEYRQRSLKKIMTTEQLEKYLNFSNQ